MYLIIGLGNPEPEYRNTRHNMGFEVINEISKKHKIRVDKTKFKALYGTGIIEEQKVILIKPQTYMNLSGESLIQFVNFYKIKKDKIIVILDDIDTLPGKIKIRKQGGAGTHNGMRSVVERLGTTEFIRIKIGIGQPEYKNDLTNYVLNQIKENEKESLITAIKTGVNAIEEILNNNIESAMNKFN